MTFAEFEQLPDPPEGFRYELRHGELVKSAPPKHRHHKIQHQLRRLLEDEAGESGEVVVGIGYRALPEHEYRVADVAYVSRARWDAIPAEGNLQGAPELVVDVLSSADREPCFVTRAVEFWVVDPVSRQVKVSTPDSRPMTYKTVTYKTGQDVPVWFGSPVAVAAIFR